MRSIEQSLTGQTLAEPETYNCTVRISRSLTSQHVACQITLSAHPFFSPSPALSGLKQQQQGAKKYL